MKFLVKFDLEFDFKFEISNGKKKSGEILGEDFSTCGNLPAKRTNIFGANFRRAERGPA